MNAFGCAIRVMHWAQRTGDPCALPVRHIPGAVTRHGEWPASREGTAAAPAKSQHTILSLALEGDRDGLWHNHPRISVADMYST